jgi:hypothetical protein
MEYRLYPVGLDGHLQPPTVIECASDADAIERVKAVLNGLPIELWQGSRLVGWFQNTSTGIAGVRSSDAATQRPPDLPADGPTLQP